MIYIVIFLLLLSGWQTQMRGSGSAAISTISFLLALILLIIGLVIGKIEMSVVIFIVFTLVSMFILMQIYRFSTYHKYFSKVFPVLIVYGTLCGYLLFFLHFSNYFILFVISNISILTIGAYNQNKFKVLCLLAENENQKKWMQKSLKNTIRFYLFSSLIYIISIVVSFYIFSLLA